MSLRVFFSVLFLLFFSSPVARAEDFHFSSDDIQFLEMVQKKALDFFLYEHDPQTGLVKDHANNFGTDAVAVSSIAATGFGLSAVVVGAENGWIPKEEARKYCLKTLSFFSDQMETHHGFFYHFVNWKTGKKTKNTELSSIDTALFLAGALTAGEYFKGTEVQTLADQIYDRVDFQWMLNGRETLSMGWDPQLQKFLNLRWQDYNESFILYLLAIGSPTHPIPADSWKKVNKRIGIYGDSVLIYSPPLFTHQYSQIWVDLRNKNDGLADYFENSRTATWVNRQFCLDHRQQFKTYSENVWGLTASLGPGGYRPYGSSPGSAVHDGTVAPTAAGSSIVFTPELSLKALKFMYQNFKDKLWGKYGFSDAFNLDRNWFASEVLAIDQGPILLMIENAKSGFVWKTFMQHPAVSRGMERIGFQPGTISLKIPPKPVLKLGSKEVEIRLESPQNRELGEIAGSSDASGRFFFSWDSEYFYFRANIQDESLVTKRKKDQIWRDDLVELFFDPQGDGFRWGKMEDLQMGFSPGPPGEKARTWIWPRNQDPVLEGSVICDIQRREDGYDINAKISWQLLGMKPKPGLSFGFTPTLHDTDADGSDGKLVWYFLPEGRSERALLGEVILEKGR